MVYSVTAKVTCCPGAPVVDPTLIEVAHAVEAPIIIRAALKPMILQCVKDSTPFSLQSENPPAQGTRLNLLTRILIASAQRPVHSSQDLVHGDFPIAARIARAASIHPDIAQRDVHHRQELIDDNVVTAIAVADAGDGRRRRGRRECRCRAGRW